MATHSKSCVLVVSFALLAGCSGEPSSRSLKNRQELEALLTAVSLKSDKDLQTSAARIETRKKAGELSETAYNDLQTIIASAKKHEWAEAVKLAYDFRENRPYFD